MADNTIDILFDLKIKEERVTRKLKEVNEIVKTADRRKRKYKEAVKDVVKYETQLANIRRQRVNINKNAAKAEKELTLATQQSSRATGGATSSVLELGRVISDAPYGIRGMANNLSQLGTSMMFTFKSAGSLMAGIKALGSALLGPLGLVIALNAVLAYFENMSMASNTLSKEMEKATKEIEEQTKALGELLDVIDSRGSSEEQVRIELFKQSKISDDIKKIYEDSNLTLDEKKKKIKDLNDLKEKELKIEKILLQIEKIKSTITTLIGTEENLSTKSIEYQNEQREKALPLIKERNRLESELSKLLKDLEGENTKVIKGSLEYWKKQLAEKRKIQQQTATNNKEYKQQQVEIDEILKKIKEIEGTEVKVNIELPEVESVFGFLKTPKEKEKEAKRIFEALKITLGDAFDDFSKAGFPTLDLPDIIDDDDVKEQFDYLNHYKEVFQTAFTGINDFIGAEYERRLTIEQNHTNKLNEELNNRLLNENLSKEDRAKIQQEIWQNDEALRKKQNEIKKKQFNTQKAFNITMATVDTYAAATKVLNDPALTGNPFARISLAAATVVSGLAQVAMIARQKFQPEAASTPIRTASGGGGGGGVGDRSFNFNLVGANQQNQLVNAIQSQFDKPLKAYVVSKDITNQQQLDANTKSTARFGG